MASSGKNFRKAQCEHHWNQMFQSSRGIFYGDISVIRVLPFTMMRLTIFFAISEALHRLFKPLKQTEYISKILAGIIIGQSVLGRYNTYEGISNLPSQEQFINTAAFYGFLYYVFIISVKTDVGVFLRFGKKFWIMGLSSMFLPYIVMVFVLIALNPKDVKIPFKAYVFTLQVSSTWFTNLSPLLEELNLLNTEFGQISLFLALTNEFILWGVTIIVILSLSFRSGILKSILPLSLTVSMIIVTVRPIILWVEKQMPRGQPIKEVYIVGILLGAGIAACMSDILIGTPIMGIALFGLVIPNGPPLGLAITERSETFVKTCLLPFFFLAVGDSVVLHIKDLRIAAVYELVLIVGHLTKTLTTMLLAMWYNMSVQQGFALGLIMNTSGVLHLVIYWNGWLRQDLHNNFSSLLIISSVLVTSIVTPLTTYFHKHSIKVVDRIQGFQLSVQSTLTSSKIQILVCTDSEDDIPGIITLLKAFNPNESNHISIYLIHLIELVGQAAPMLKRHKKHKRICKYNGCTHIMNAIESYCKTTRGGVTMQLMTMISPFTSIHEGICKVAEESMVPLVIVPFVYKNKNHLGKNASSHLNIKLQQQISCTIGIFVNMDRTKNSNQSHFSYHIGVIFCGGEDDREALTFATRMSTHPGVTVTTFQIFIKDYDHINVDEGLLDDYVIDKFKAKISNSSSVVFKEIHIEEWLQIHNVIQSLDNIYDLVIVGKCHGGESSVEEEYDVFSDNPELGEIGELIVADENRWENTSVLVLQHCRWCEKETLGSKETLEGHY